MAEFVNVITQMPPTLAVALLAAFLIWQLRGINSRLKDIEGDIRKVKDDNERQCRQLWFIKGKLGIKDNED